MMFLFRLKLPRDKNFMERAFRLLPLELWLKLVEFFLHELFHRFPRCQPLIHPFLKLKQLLLFLNSEFQRLLWNLRLF